MARLISMKKNIKFQKGAGVILNIADGYETKARVMPSLTTLSTVVAVSWAKKPRMANTTNPANSEVSELAIPMMNASLRVLFVNLLYEDNATCDPIPSDNESRI